MSAWLLGPHAIEEALAANRPLEVVYLLEGKRNRDLLKLIDRIKASDICIKYVPQAFFKQIRGSKDIPHQGIAAKGRSIGYHDLKSWLSRQELSKNPVVLLLDHIEDPQNFGAILRTAAAFSVAGVIIPKRRMAPFDSAAERAAAGGQHYIPIVQVSNIAETIVRLRDEGWMVLGTTGGEGELLQDADLNGPIAFVLGSEHEGLHRLVKERCDSLIKIPMSEKVESLNVSVAAGICLWELFRGGAVKKQ